MKTVLARIAIVGLILIAGIRPGRAQTAGSPTGRALDEVTSQVASQLRCPVCRQLSIEDSSSELALEARALIRERLAGGQSPEEVKAYFVEKYGEWILLSPPKQGFTLLVWVLPVVALLAGAVVLARVFRRWLPEPGAGEPVETREATS